MSFTVSARREEQWPQCLSLGSEAVLPGDRAEPSSISEGVVCEGEGTRLLVICSACIFIFACAQAPRGPCLEKQGSSEAGEGIF